MLLPNAMLSTCAMLRTFPKEKTMLKMFAIKDEKVQAFLKPFLVPHVADATRAIIGMLSVPPERRSTIAEFPEDYSLWYIGTFSEASGGFDPGVEFVANIVTLRDAAQQKGIRE